MNSYLNHHINAAHRKDLVDDAASNRVGSTQRLPEAGPERGVRAAIRRILSAPEANTVGFMPRLVDYPSARR